MLSWPNVNRSHFQDIISTKYYRPTLCSNPKQKIVTKNPIVLRITDKEINTKSKFEPMKRKKQKRIFKVSNFH